MRNNILESLKGLKKIFNYYLALIGFLFLTWTSSLSLLNKQRSPDSPINIFDIDVYAHYFSLVYGLVFMTFILVLFLGIRQLRTTIENHEEEFSKEKDSKLVNLFPWLTSPFHQSRLGPIGFALAISLGFIGLALVTVGHLRGVNAPNQEIIELWVYQYFIGTVDAVSFVVCLVLILIAIKDISWIRDNLEYPASNSIIPVEE